MKRSPIGNGGRQLLLALLFMAAAPLAAQQAVVSAPRPAVGAALAPAPRAVAGPQAHQAWQPVRPAFVNRNLMASSSSSDSHTITVSTIVLVLAVVILVLLILR